MNAYIIKCGDTTIAIDDAGNICGNGGSVAGSIAEAADFADYYHQQKVSLELVHESGGSKKARRAVAQYLENMAQEAKQ
ncbi:MAG: hypothetical protein WC381_10705 [Kiritimatiellia bacterium]|jgi:hypothetical protein